MFYPIAFIISALIGIFTLTTLLYKDRPGPGLLISLGTLLGLGFSAVLTWSSFIIFNKLIPGYAIALNIAAVLILGYLAHQRVRLQEIIRWQAFDRLDGAGLLLIIILAIPTLIHATLYPYGGWDAWSCWNLKAKFLFLGGDQWRNLFDPLLWRSNISYPLLLPLINVWIWCFGAESIYKIPLAVSCVISTLTASILFFTIKKMIQQKFWALIATALVFSCLFNIKLASSQYSDLLLGAYFLAALGTFLMSLKTCRSAYLVLSAISLGLLSFTKTEGMMLAAITAVLILISLFKMQERFPFKESAAWFLTTLMIALVPAITFLLFFAPDSHTFINGLVSIEKPSGWIRTQTIGFFLAQEFISLKWNGFWILSTLGLIISAQHCLKKELLIIPLAILCYLGAICAFYYVNTFFDIAWWLSTTLNRVLFSLIPAVTLWVFLALDEAHK